MNNDHKTLINFMIKALNEELEKIIDLNKKYKLNNIELKKAFELVLRYYSLLELQTNKKQLKKIKEQFNKLKIKLI
jgi:hypothetical protein